MQLIVLVLEQLHAHLLAIGLGGKDIDDLAAHPVRGAVQFHVIAHVLEFGQPPQEGVGLLHAGEPCRGLGWPEGLASLGFPLISMAQEPQVNSLQLALKAIYSP